MTKVFIIMLEFSSWDNCRAYAADHDISMQDTYAMCVPYEYETPTAPETSLRPKARADQKK